MHKLIKTLSPARIIALGFASVILIGSLLLMLPCSVRPGVELSFIDSLYTSTSAVCVTGLVCVDSYNTFTPIGQCILGALIQIGGLGVTSVGAGIILAVGKKMDLKGRSLVKEAMNLESGKGIVVFVKSVFFTTIIIEFIGALLSFLVFVGDYPLPRAIGMSIFHSIASFNNAGFDIVGDFQNFIPYRNNVLLNIVTCALIFLGGIGFLVIREMWAKKFHFKKYSMHAKVVLTVSIALIIIGGLLIKCTEDISWMAAFFHSVSARTAGFASYPLGEFTNAGLMVMMVLMAIGASSGSTGGGIKTSTFFVLLQGVKSAATNKSEKAFKYAIPRECFRKAAVITLLAISVIVGGTYLLCVMEPQLEIVDAMFEVTSAFGTVGLSTGITTTLGIPAKMLSIFIMYIGRLGPLTIATLWYFSRGERVKFPEGNIAIG